MLFQCPHKKVYLIKNRPNYVWFKCYVCWSVFEVAYIGGRLEFIVFYHSPNQIMIPIYYDQEMAMIQLVGGRRLLG